MDRRTSQGLDLRLELGPKDMAKRQVRIVRRDTNAKEDVPINVLAQASYAHD